MHVVSGLCTMYCSTNCALWLWTNTRWRFKVHFITIWRAFPLFRSLMLTPMHWLHLFLIDVWPSIVKCGASQRRYTAFNSISVYKIRKVPWLFSYFKFRFLSFVFLSVSSPNWWIHSPALHCYCDQWALRKLCHSVKFLVRVAFENTVGVVQNSADITAK